MEYRAQIKNGVSCQSDPTKHCYAYAAEYADAGHGNHTAEEFLKLNDYAAGGDVSILIGAPANAKLRLYGENSQKLFENIFNFGRNLQNGIFEAAGIIKGSHWVNIIGISSYDKISWFGNNVTNHQMLRIWNPIEGVISWITGEQVTNVKVFSF